MSARSYALIQRKPLTLPYHSNNEIYILLWNGLTMSEYRFSGAEASPTSSETSTQDNIGNNPSISFSFLTNKQFYDTCLR